MFAQVYKCKRIVQTEKRKNQEQLDINNGEW